MAFPTILVNATGGSDSAASGAGPSTALTGSDASTSGDGLTVTVPNADLTNVAVDGSHVIYLADATAGNRNFGKITAKADSGLSSANVTVANAFGVSLSGQGYAIGGKRASIGGTESKKLLDNNGAAGDALPGWVVEFQSGHTETIAATLSLRGVGDTTDGPIILRGESGAATLPVITFSNNGDALSMIGASTQIRDFELRNSNATKTASRAIVGNTPRYIHFSGMKISHSSDKFWRGVVIGAASGGDLYDSEIGYCADIGVITPSGFTGEIGSNWIHDCTNQGLHMTASGGSTSGYVVIGNIFAGNGDGILVNSATTNTGTFAVIAGNTFYDNTDGLELNGDFSANTTFGFALRNNIFDGNTNDVNFSHANMNATVIAARGWTINNNCFTGTTVPTGIGTNNQTASPTFTNAAGNDYSIGTNLKAKGHPLGGTTPVGTYSSTYSYVDIGAAQRQEPAGGGDPFPSQGLQHIESGVIA